MSAKQDILEALTSGINSEIAAYVFYLEALKKVDDEALKKILSDLALEEKKHFQVLERKFDAQVRSEKWITTADVLNQDGLPEIDSRMASKHKDLIASIQNMTTNRAILDMALKLEEEARDLFAGLAQSAESEEAKQTFRHLAGFEEGHVTLIKSLIADLPG